MEELRQQELLLQSRKDCMLRSSHPQPAPPRQRENIAPPAAQYALLHQHGNQSLPVHASASEHTHPAQYYASQHHEGGRGLSYQENNNISRAPPPPSFKQHRSSYNSYVVAELMRRSVLGEHNGASGHHGHPDSRIPTIPEHDPRAMNGAPQMSSSQPESAVRTLITASGQGCAEAMGLAPCSGKKPLWKSR